MKDIVIWLIITGSLLLIFVLMLFIAIVRKSKRLAVWSVLPVLISVLTGGFTVYKMINRSYYAIKNIKAGNPFKARTGKEIYVALFKKPDNDCVSVANYKDQYIPGLDCCVWLELYTCPQELARIINQEKYESEKISSSYINISGNNEKPEWWKPAQLGDSVLFFRHDYEGRRLQQLLSSVDSTKVFYCDMLF
jgi:hypothetical protein